MHATDLDWFVAVCRHASISRAAIAIGVSQSALSRRLQQLEAELGGRLLHRTGRGVQPTEAGQLLMERASGVLSELASIQAAVSELAGARWARVAVGMTPAVAAVLRTPLLREWTAMNPGLEVVLVEGISGLLLEQLKSGGLDFAVLYHGAANAFVQCEPLLSEELFFIAPRGGRTLPARLPVERLADVPLVLTARPHALRLLVEEHVRHAGRTLQVRFECNGSLEMTRGMVRDGFGYTVLPLAAVKPEVDSGALVAVPLEPPLRREIVLATAVNRPAPAGLQRLVLSTRELAVQLASTGRWPGCQSSTGMRPMHS